MHPRNERPEPLGRRREGCSPARSGVDYPITTSGAAPLIVDGFRRVRRSTFTEGPIMERAEYKTAKDGARHATIASRDPTRHRAGSTWEARNLLNRQSLFEICVSIPSLTKSLSGALEQFQHN